MCKRDQKIAGLFLPVFYCLVKERVAVINSLDKICKCLEPAIPRLLLM